MRSDQIIRSQNAIGIETAQLTSQRYQDFDEMTEEVEGVHYQRTRAPDSFFGKIPVLGYTRHLASRVDQVVRQFKPDVIHAHSPALNGIAAANVGKKHGIPVAYEIRAFWEDAAVDTGKTQEGRPRYRLVRALETTVCRRASQIICICEGLRQDVIARGFDESKVAVAPNAVDTAKFQPAGEKDAELVDSLGLQGKKVVAFIGSFFKYEGLAYAVEAMKIIASSRRDLVLLLVGAGNEYAALRQQVIDEGLSEAVLFTGRVPFSEVGRYYSVADLMLFPRESIRLTELVTPLKPLEAMAMMKPVAASDIGGHRELIEDGRTGFLFEADRADILAKRIQEIVDDEEGLKSVTRNAIEFVERERNWRSVARTYMDIYTGLV
jgi:PEP-CTERM/exosortase A-associated glycosyltransferase